MNNKICRYTLRIDRVLFQKFRYTCDYEIRSVNKQLERYIKKHVATFEEKQVL